LRTPEKITIKCGIFVFETSRENGSIMKAVLRFQYEKCIKGLKISLHPDIVRAVRWGSLGGVLF
jgi:hypothetical protein